MDTQELLKSWPGVGKAGAETLLSLPAWRMRLDMDGREAELVRSDAAATDEILLTLDLDGEELTLGLSDSPLFPDLHLLWTKRGGLPSELVLALVEKECGDVFGALEASTHKLLSVKGLADSTAEAGRLAFCLKTGDGEVVLSLSRNRTVELAFGRLANIDCTHESIRSLTREVEAEYASYPSAEVPVASLAAGDLLLLSSECAPLWRLDDPADDALHLRGVLPTKLDFGSLADDALPPVPEPGQLKLVCRGATVATGEVVACGDVRGFRIQEITK